MDKKFNDSKHKNIVEIKEDLKKLNEIDKTLIPQYLDNLKNISNKGKKVATKNNEFLKYM